MGLRGPKRRRAGGRRGFAKKILTEEELRIKNSKIRERKASTVRDHAKEWRSRQSRLTEEERAKKASEKKTRDRIRYLAQTARRLRDRNKAINKGNSP